MKNIKNFYDINVIKYKQSYKQNGWGQKKSQQLRFKVFTDIDNLNQRKILDLGCGTGDLKSFFQKKKIKVNYTGLENNESMINVLKKKKIRYIKSSIFDLKKFKSNLYDFILMSGALNIPVKNQETKISQLLKNSFRIAKKGVALNFLSIYSNKINKNEFYADPVKIFNMSKKICKKVVLRHDYLPHDFTIILYKK